MAKSHRRKSLRDGKISHMKENKESKVSHMKENYDKWEGRAEARVLQKTKSRRRQRLTYNMKEGCHVLNKGMVSHVTQAWVSPKAWTHRRQHMKENKVSQKARSHI